jgi:hypothetical protein
VDPGSSTSLLARHYTQDLHTSGQSKKQCWCACTDSFPLGGKRQDRTTSGGLKQVFVAASDAIGECASPYAQEIWLALIFYTVYFGVFKLSDEVFCSFDADLRAPATKKNEL